MNIPVSFIFLFIFFQFLTFYSALDNTRKSLFLFIYFQKLKIKNEKMFKVDCHIVSEAATYETMNGICMKHFICASKHFTINVK